MKTADGYDWEINSVMSIAEIISYIITACTNDIIAGDVNFYIFTALISTLLCLNTRNIIYIGIRLYFNVLEFVNV